MGLIVNERIKELAEQAYPHNDNVNIFRHHDGLEKFAELIVQECVDKIETYRIPVGNSPAGEMACEWTYDALKEIRDDIKEHFGVE